LGTIQPRWHCLDAGAGGLAMPILAASAGALVAVLIPIIIIVIVALVLIYCVQKFLPEVYDIARIIIGGAALILILYKLLPLLS
jgi:hypothetical protein